jgi:cytidylate kinase
MIIAIDGPAGSGKSTVARAVATKLGLDYLDTGAMYRSVAFAAIRRGIDPDDTDAVAELARRVTIDVSDTVMVDGVDATIEIRGPEVTRAVSVVAANPAVRAELRDRQRAWQAAHGGGVVEGRDIGTVVFPGADLKVYLTASDTERARRRHNEVSALHYDADSPALAVEQVQADLAARDHMDSTRAAAPLAVAPDAVVIDTTGRTVEDIVTDVLARLDQPAPPAAERSAADAPARKPGTDAHGAWRPEPKGRIGQTFDRALYAFCRTAIHGFGVLYWRLRIVGRENLPTSGAFIVAPVHRSNVDTPLVGAITRRRMRFMGKDSLWKTRAGARFLSALGGFPVHRGSADRDALRRCIEVIAGGEPLVLFPEGTRQSGPDVHPLFEGAAYVAARTGVPIVPVGIAGTEKAMPKGSKLLYPTRVAMVVGEPLPPPDSRSRRAIHEQTERLHERLQVVFDEAKRLVT